MYGPSGFVRGLPVKREYNSMHRSGPHLYWRVRFLSTELSAFDDDLDPQKEAALRNVYFYDGAGNEISDEAEINFSLTWTENEAKDFGVGEDRIYWAKFPRPVYVPSYAVYGRYFRNNWVLEFSNDNRVWIVAHKAYCQDIIDAGDYDTYVTHTYEVV